MRLVLELTSVLITAGVAALVLSVVYFAVWRLSGSVLSAMLVGCEALVVFALLPHLVSAATSIGLYLGTSNRVGYGVLLAALLAAALLLGVAGRKLSQDLLLIPTVALAAVFLMNLVPTVIQLAQERQADSETYQTEFQVEAKTETPNVYWIHCDGMLSPATVEKYWDYDGSAFRGALAANGFTLYPDTMLEASHFTTVAIPALMSPYFYDHTLREVLDADPDDHYAGRTFIKANPKLMREALRQNETIAAFHQAGYTTNVLSLNTNDYFFPVNADHFYAVADHNLHKEEAYAAELASKPYLLLDDPYDESDAADKYINLGELAGGSAGRALAEKLLGGAKTEGTRAALTHLLTQDAVNEVLEGNELGVKFYTPLVQAVWDMTFSETPRMSVVHFEMAHYPFNMSLTGTIPYPDNIWDVRNYGVHYAYTEKVLQNLLQLILTQDPDAVIVLAADHGLHEVDFEQPICTYFGEDALLPMWNNVLYAVRLPSSLQSEETTALLTDPRNIARFLVNTYVGQNYDYVTE